MLLHQHLRNEGVSDARINQNAVRLSALRERNEVHLILRRRRGTHSADVRWKWNGTVVIAHVITTFQAFPEPGVEDDGTFIVTLFLFSQSSKECFPPQYTHNPAFSRLAFSPSLSLPRVLSGNSARVVVVSVVGEAFFKGVKERDLGLGTNFPLSVRGSAAFECGTDGSRRFSFWRS